MTSSQAPALMNDQNVVIDGNVGSRVRFSDEPPRIYPIPSGLGTWDDGSVPDEPSLEELKWSSRQMHDARSGKVHQYEILEEPSSPFRELQASRPSYGASSRAASEAVYCTTSRHAEPEARAQVPSAVQATKQFAEHRKKPTTTKPNKDLTPALRNETAPPPYSHAPSGMTIPRKPVPQRSTSSLLPSSSGLPACLQLTRTNSWALSTTFQDIVSGDKLGSWDEDTVRRKREHSTLAKAADAVLAVQKFGRTALVEYRANMDASRANVVEKKLYKMGFELVRK
ncbi:hypothetical protein EJ04DRAFT_582238 [Polyplosphaeria fusca]|uniref:Uncharacterized protein n=1 Tax=Polyplosphaeria fusca TaxID=682080 RepID=A0A9P4QIM1_9PLEO|nr:hypothetical protein EJ04DRAFT_582238 [Polyplosphaeria fusca]